MKKRLLLLCSFLLIVFLSFVALESRGPIDRDQHTYATVMRLSDIGLALELFRKEAGRYPTTNEGLDLLVSKNEKTQYLRLLPSDSWGRFFVYSETPGAVHPFVLYSTGRNGVNEDGNGDDIEYWKREEKLPAPTFLRRLIDWFRDKGAGSH
jgi:general secretion pathway protein G